jgi:hypothetical protein
MSFFTFESIIIIVIKIDDLLLIINIFLSDRSLSCESLTHFGCVIAETCFLEQLWKQKRIIS